MENRPVLVVSLQDHRFLQHVVAVDPHHLPGVSSSHDGVAPQIIDTVAVGVVILLLVLIRVLFFKLGLQLLSDVQVRQSHGNPTGWVKVIIVEQNRCHVVPVERVHPIYLPMIRTYTIFGNVDVFVNSDIQFRPVLEHDCLVVSQNV